MALFKISKGTKSNLDNQTLTEGYCWFTPEDGKFYIDAFKNEVLTRIPLNAAVADSVAWTNVTGRPGNATSTKGGILTDAQAVKFAGIATGAEVNQNAFSNIKIGSTTVAADAKTDTVEFTGSNITISGDATNDKVTFSLTKANVTTALGYTPPTTNTTYDIATQSASGLMSAEDKTKLNGIATGAEVNQNAFSNIKVGSTTVAADAKTDTVEFVGSNVTITPDATNDKVTFSLTSSNVTTALGYTPPQQDTTYSAATQSAAGLMSAADKKKLDGVATGAQVNVIESVSASGTAPLTLNASTSNKAVSITGSVADASTSAKGVVKLDATTLNTWINQLSTGSSTPIDADYYISQYVGGGTSTTTYHRRPMSALWLYISGKISAAGYAKTANVVTNVAWDGTNKKLTKTIGSTTSDVVTASTLKTDLGLSSAMLFMGSLGTDGTITSLPAAAAGNQGYTYKVITANTYANQAAKVGDVFVSNGSSWVLIPSGDEPSGTVTSITLKAGTGISLDTDNTAITTSGTRTISHADTSSQASVSASGRRYITGVTLDTYGHVTGLTTGTETVTNTDTKVTQTVKTDNAEYAILTKDSTAVTTTTASSNFASNITINPSTNTISTTGFIKTTKGTYSYNTGSENVSGFFKFATLTISGAYANCGIQISYTSRSRTGGTIYLICSNTSSSDPALTITKTGPANIYYIKSATSTWDLYINKTENYDDLVFNIINPGQLQRGSMTLTWSNTSVTTLPTGYETAAIHTIEANITGNATTATSATSATSATKATQDGNGNVISSTYLKLSGGTMTGGVTFIGNQASAYNDKGIIFTKGSRIGENTNGGIGVYGVERVYIRPGCNGSSSGDGIEISTAGVTPSNNNSETLGDSSHKWSNVYATTFTGNLVGNADTASTASSVALSGVTGADDLKAIEALTGTSGILKKTAANTWTLDTTAYTTNTGTVTKVTAGTGLAIGSTAQGNFTTTGTINHTNSVTAKTAAAQSAKTLTWGGTFTLYEEKYDTCGHITGVASYNMTMPSNPNTDIKQNITLATTSKAYLTGVTTTPTSSAQALTGVADTGVYLTATAGEISAVRHSFNVSGTEKAYMAFNNTTNAIDFIFN